MGSDLNTCEVINLEASATTCKDPPNFPVGVSGAIGGLGFKLNPIICGGAQDNTRSKNCSSLENNKWVSSVNMNTVRQLAAAAQLQDGKLLVTGGLMLNSAEMLTEKGWESKIPSLPVIIENHCMITVNSTTVMVIGGVQNRQGKSGKTFLFTFGEENWTEGPALKYERYLHSCGRIRRDKESQGISIIVAGGINGTYMSSVEILHEGSNEWQTGPNLPFGIEKSQMVEDQNGGLVLIGGEFSTFKSLDTIYQIPHGGKDAKWTKMEQKLKTGRYQHTAFLVPDNIVDCS